MKRCPLLAERDEVEGGKENNLSCSFPAVSRKILIIELSSGAAFDYNPKFNWTPGSHLQHAPHCCHAFPVLSFLKVRCTGDQVGLATRVKPMKACNQREALLAAHIKETHTHLRNIF